MSEQLFVNEIHFFFKISLLCLSININVHINSYPHSLMESGMMIFLLLIKRNALMGST